MTAAQLVGIALSVILLVVLALIATYSIGEFLAFYQRFKQAREFEEWKRDMLRIPPLKKRKG